MTTITEYTYTPMHLAEIIDLVNFCQNIEAHLNIKMREQSDLFDIEHYYQATGGNFWTAIDHNEVVGTIALLPLNKETAVLKKFFTYPDYRGGVTRLGRQLFDTFETFAVNHAFRNIVLDTPEAESRSHAFYEHHGFKQLRRDEVTFDYTYPDRNSRFYLKQIG